jgi:hypothetical protein
MEEKNEIKLIPCPQCGEYINVDWSSITTKELVIGFECRCNSCESNLFVSFTSNIKVIKV